MIMLAKERFKSFRMFFFLFFTSIIVTELVKNNQTTVLFGQKCQHFGNSTLFDLQEVDQRSQYFRQLKFKSGPRYP